MLKRRRVRKSDRINGDDLKKTHSFIDLDCSKGCGKTVRVDSNVVSVICWHCTAMSVAPPDIKPVYKKTDAPRKPKGWHFMKVFVDSEGNVFHEGKEQPSLKGTLPATTIKPRKSMAEKEKEEAKKQKKLLKLYEKKKRLKEQNGNNQIGMGSDNLPERKEEPVSSS
jgi:hypothetical protein